MIFTGPEKRKNPRIKARFIVSYRILDESDNIDITQTKNFSLGGMLLTTNRNFKPGTNLAIEIRLPFDIHPIMLIGRVAETHEVSKDLIYDARIEFLAVDERHKPAINQTVGYYMKKDTK